MEYSDVSALVLAAGKGTRMKSDRAKVLHEVFFAPMIHHVVEAVDSLGLGKVVVVTGHQREQVEKSLSDYDVVFAEQKEQLGTGHAVLAGEHILKNRGGSVLILCGDTPLIQTDTLKELLIDHTAKKAELTVMTTVLDNPTNYGRVVTAEDGAVARIVEEKDATSAELRICEVNTGIYCAANRFLFDTLRQVGTDNKQGEVYLTDIVEIAGRAGHAVNRYICNDPEEVLGVNSRVELARAHASLSLRRNTELMLAGVTLMKPETISIEKTAMIGRDTTIYPHVLISGNSVIGSGCTMHPFTVIKDCRIPDGISVGSFSCLMGCTVPEGEDVAPNTCIVKPTGQ